MIELKRFQLRLAKSQPAIFNFERASLAVLSRHKYRDAFAGNLVIASEWRDPPAFRYKSADLQGVHSHD